MSFILQRIFVMNESAPISFTKAAKVALKANMQEHDLTETKLRVGVKALGNFSTTYLLAFDQEEPDDTIFNIEGFTVLIAKKDMMFVMGLEVDYGQRGKDVGFIFNDPKR